MNSRKNHRNRRYFCKKHQKNTKFCKKTLDRPLFSVNIINTRGFKMLVSFSVENFLSFKERVDFTMEKTSKSTKHKELVKNGLLKGACIYGANNSGKTNLIRSIQFVVDAIEEGNVSRIYKTHYSFIPNDDKVSKFELTFKQNKHIYKYVMECNFASVEKEELYCDKKTVFKRTATDLDRLSDYGILSNTDYYLNRKFTKSDLFLSKLRADNVLQEPNLKHQEIFQDIFKWLKQVFCVRLDSAVGGAFYVYMEQKEDFKNYLQELLEEIDPSITQIEWEPIEGAKLNELLVNASVRFRDSVPEHLFIRKGYDFFILDHLENNRYTGKKLYTYHNNERFEIDWESDGTKKIIELSLAFYLLKTTNAIVLIDELDSSLHPVMVRYLLQNCMDSEQQSQIITTLHNINLLTQELWRVDQIWFAEKTTDGRSKLYSLQQFAPRFDKKVLKDYLQGRYGAIPSLGVWKW